MPDVHVIGGPSPVGLDDLRRRIADYLGGTRVERAIVFGSFARGSADCASDLDLVLIEPTDAPFVERGRAHPALFHLGVGVDLLVYTKDEYERLLAEGNPLVERIEVEGLTVYARSAS